MVLPPRWEATVESSTGMTLGDLQNFIRYCDEQIDASALAQVLDLGTSQEGSRALGRTLGEIFDESVQSTGQYVCDTLNAENGVIEELCKYNFPDWEENVPKLAIGKVEKMDLKNWSLGFQALVNAGVKFGGKTHGWIREEAGLPEEEELDELATKEAMKPPPKPAAPAARPAGPYVPPGEGDFDPGTKDVNPEPTD
jgi:phage gp29-like protein